MRRRRGVFLSVKKGVLLVPALAGGAPYSIQRARLEGVVLAFCCSKIAHDAALRPAFDSL